MKRTLSADSDLSQYSPPQSPLKKNCHGQEDDDDEKSSNNEEVTIGASVDEKKPCHSPPKVVPKKDSGSRRCQNEPCRKKLSLVDQTLVCKCGQVFCSQHRHSRAHACEFDFSKENVDKLQRQASEWQEQQEQRRGNLKNKI